MLGLEIRMIIHKMIVVAEDRIQHQLRKLESFYGCNNFRNLLLNCVIM